MTTTTTNQCGAKDLRNGYTCIQPAGHVGVHASRTGYVWKEPGKAEKKPKKVDEPPKSLLDKCAKCGYELGEHDGKKCPKRAAKQLAPCPAQDARGFACSKVAGHGDEHSNAAGWQTSRPAPMTLADEPEDEEADAAAIAAMDADETVHLGYGGSLAHVPDLDDEPAEPPEDGDDPFEDEVRSDADRDLACQHREAREMHARDIEATATPAPSPSVVLTKIGVHDVHPAAALFPLIGGDEYQAFLDDIRTNGQRKKIVRIGALILDGRNRLRACLDLKIEPKFRTFGSDLGDGTDPIAFVISENIARRHLNETQRSFVGAELVPMYEAQAKERQREGGRGKGSANWREADTGKATALAARAVNVGAKSVERALQVKRDAAPEVLAAARDRGQIKVSTAAELVKLPKEKQQEIVSKIGGGELRSGKVRAYVSQEKKRDVVRKINEQRVAPMPMGPFGVIYGDYPWHYDNSDQHEGSRGHLGYPTMKFDEVLAHAREAAKRAAKNCILALWSTNLYVTRMDQVIEAYGAERHTVYTWPKPRAGVGSWGRGQTEHLVIASIGSPVHTLNEISTLLPSWKPEHPGEHSSKPKEVAELLAKHCAGPFLEIFARDQREGWACWGAEADKFKGAA